MQEVYLYNQNITRSQQKAVAIHGAHWYSTYIAKPTQAGAAAVNSNQPGSSGVDTAADSIEKTTETTTQHPAEVEVGKQAASRAREAAQRAREAAGRTAQQESGVEQAREVGPSGSTQAAHES